MAQEVAIPRLGWGMEKGTFVEWRKRHGDRVDEGEIVFVMEGDKATQEIESLGRGLLHVVPSAPAPGDEVAVGRVIAFLLDPGEAPPPEPALRPASPPAAAPPSPVRLPRRAPAEPRHRKRVASSPRARRAARELGVDWSALAGSGTSGRVTERDVRAAADRPGGVPRAATAGPWSALGVEVDARRLTDLAERAAASAEGGPGPAAVLTGLLVRLCAQAAASLGTGRGIRVGVARAAAGSRDWLVVADADGARVLELARRLAGPVARDDRRDPGAEGAMDLRIVNAAGLGVDAYEPGPAEPGAPLVVVGRPRRADGLMAVTLRFHAGGASLGEAAAFLARAREALEAPDLWLAR